MSKTEVILSELRNALQEYNEDAELVAFDLNEVKPNVATGVVNGNIQAQLYEKDGSIKDNVNISFSFKTGELL